MDHYPNHLAQPPDGKAKLAIREMGSRYLFVCLYVSLEKYFIRGDYRKTGSTHKLS